MLAVVNELLVEQAPCWIHLTLYRVNARHCLSNKKTLEVINLHY